MTLMSFTFGVQREINGLYNVHLKSLNIQGIKFSIWSQNWCILYFFYESRNTVIIEKRDSLDSQ